MNKGGDLVGLFVDLAWYWGLAILGAITFLIYFYAE